MKKIKNIKLPSCAALIAAGGSGLRMGGPVKKQFINVAGKSILRHSIKLFLDMEEIVRIVVVLPEDSLEVFSGTLTEKEKQVVELVSGGETRQDSVYNGLRALAGSGVQVVAIHDAARPLVSPQVIRKTLELAARGTPALACTPVRDTVKLIKSGFVESTLDRDGLWLAQTPQTFPLGLIIEAHEAAWRDKFHGTDDVSLCERMGIRVEIVESDADNIKITDKTDLDYLEYRLKGVNVGEVSMRIGEGFDIHTLTEGRPLVIGGVEIPFEKGLDGHSDADVLLHAITDALLGAAALGDIGQHFPDSDPAYRGADSGELLSQVVKMLKERGFSLVNLDATVIAQRPKLAPYIGQIREKIARILEVDDSKVSVKAKTHEGLDSIGRGEGISARASVLISTE